MTNRKNARKYKIARSAIKQDSLFFGIPALIVFTFGLIVSAMDGYNGLVAILWQVVKDPRMLHQLSGMNILGLALFIIGLTIALIAVFTLKQYYSSFLVIRLEHQLITHGIYRYVRHPVYLGVLMAVFGAPVYASSPKGLLAMACLIPIFLNRIRMEERLLITEFGDGYRAYQKSTRKLIPFIY